MLIGLFTHLEWHWSWPKIWPMIDGARRAARANGIRIFILDEPSAGWEAESGEIDRIETAYADYLSLFDGFVSVFPNPDFGRYAASIKTQGKPVVLIGRRSGDVARVLLDNCEAFRKAVGRLAKRGHRRIVIMAGPEDNLCASERLRGYRLGLEDAGIPFDSSLVVSTGFSDSTAKDALETFFRSGHHGTAILSTNDLAAHAALEVLVANKLRVPEDVELIGFDNVPNSLWSTPSLSTFEMHAEDLGAEAIQACFNLINGMPQVKETILRSTYIARDSTRDDFESMQKEPLDQDLMLAQIDRLDAKLDIEQTVAERLTGKIASALDDSSLSAKPAAELLRRIMFNEVACVSSQREIDLRFNYATLRLKELSFRQLPEIDIMKQLWLAFSQLGITQLRAQVNFTGDPSEAQWYLNGQYMATDDFDSPRIQEFLNATVHSTSVVMVPLTYEKLRFGFILIEADSSFAPRFWELIRDFSAALYSARLIATLRANRALEVATKTAETARAEAERSYEALKLSQHELTRTQAALVESSRLAGIGEMARDILHKVGNTLNSVNTSVGVLDSQTKTLRVKELKKAIELLDEQIKLRPSAATFEKTSKVIDYLRAAAAAFENHQSASMDELRGMKSMLDDVIGIVASQSRHANVVAIIESFPFVELLNSVRVHISPKQGFRLVTASSADNKLYVSVKGTKQRAFAALLSTITTCLHLAEENYREAELVLRFEVNAPASVSLICSAPSLPSEDITASFSMTKREESSDLLSLHDAANAMAEMGGRISILHDESRGRSEFVVTFPLSAKPI